MTRLAWRVIGLTLVAASASAQAVAPPDGRLLVIPFENSSGQPQVFWLSEGSAVLLTDDLRTLGAPAISRDDRRRAFERLNVPPVASLSHASVIRLGQIVQAATVVVGSFDIRGDELTVRARTIRLDTGRLSPELVEHGPLADTFAVYAAIARRLVPAAEVTAQAMEQGQPPIAAFEQYIKGLLAEAPQAKVGFFTQALRLYPSFHRSRIGLWEVHTDQGEHGRALTVVRQVPPTSRLSRLARFRAALSMVRLGQLPQARDAFQQLHDERSDPALLNNLGIVRLRTTGAAGDGSAISFFAQAVNADPTDADLFFNLGYAHWLQRDLQGAIHWLREAVRRNTADDAAHYVLGVALQAAGNNAEAIREKELARQLSSTYAEWEARQPASNSVPARLERLKGEIDVPPEFRVEDAIVAAAQRDQRALALFHLERGRRMVQQEKYDDALAELRRVVYLAPYQSDAHVLLARVHLQQGRAKDALDALRVAVWSDPANTEAAALLAEHQEP